LATLGQRALSSRSLGVLFDDAVATLATALDVEYCKVLKRSPDGDALLLVAGVGWRDGLVGRETVGTDAASQAGYTLLSNEPVIATDLRTETRFTGPPLLTEHGVVSGMSVIIRCMEGPWGVLGAHTVHRRDFNKEEVQFLQAVANLLGMAIERERADEARRQSEDRMRASQKLEAIGRLAGGIAHDFNNLLTVIMSSAEMLGGDGEHEAAEGIMSAAGRAASLTHQLLAFSRQQILQPRILDINVEISQLDEMLRRMLGEDVELVTALASDVGCVRADPSQIQQVILNLAVNARDALPSGGRLGIETAKVEIGNDRLGEHASLGPGSYVAIRVSDTGVGMDAETRSKVFEPFFTTKGDSGTGIGLATVHGIVTQSGGSIRIESEKGRGSTFEILLPRVAEQLDTPVELAKAANALDGVETILVVEDNEAVRELICLGLRKRGYDVLEASGSVAALEASEQYPGPIALVVTDMVMPGMRGAELMRRLRDARPGLGALVVSGYARDTGDESWQQEPSTSFLAKPFTSAQLAQKVREVLDN
jgi:signal transduction histidine kinase